MKFLVCICFCFFLPLSDRCAKSSQIKTVCSSNIFFKGSRFRYRWDSIQVSFHKNGHTFCKDSTMTGRILTVKNVWKECEQDVCVWRELESREKEKKDNHKRESDAGVDTKSYSTTWEILKCKFTHSSSAGQHSTTPPLLNHSDCALTWDIYTPHVLMYFEATDMLLVLFVHQHLHPACFCDLLPLISQ